MIKERAKKLFDAVWRGLLGGIIVGIILTFFILGAEEIMSFVKEIFRLSRNSWFLIILLFIILLFIAFLINVIFSYIPEIDGNFTEKKREKRKFASRITDFDWLKRGFAYFLSTYLSFLAGLPFGAERPSAYLGISLSQGIARYTGGKNVQMSEVFGESAAVAVAVRGPITGSVYAVEEYIKKTRGKGLNFYLIIGTLISAFTSYVIAFLFMKLVFGQHFSSFENIAFPYVSMKYALHLALLGLVIGTGSGLFFILSKLCQDFFRRVDITPFWLIAAAITVTAIVGLIEVGDFHGSELLGGGTNLIVSATKNEFSSDILGIYFALKFAVILIALCSGASGGLFIPSMVLGALLGGLMCRVFAIWGMPSEYFSSIILISAAAFMGCYLHLPFTSLFLSLELAGFNMFSDGYSFGLIAASFIVNLIAYSVSLLYEIKTLTGLGRMKRKTRRK